MGKSKLLFIAGFFLFIGSGWYSATQYQALQKSAEEELVFLDTRIEKDHTIIPKVNLEKLHGIEKFSKYQPMEARDLFSKFKPKKIEPVKPILPKVRPKVTSKIKELPKPEPEPEIEEPKIRYYYRGTMMVDGRETHIVEQENPYKWHFLKPDGSGPNKDLKILEIGRYGVTVEDKEGEVFELKIKKEF